MTNSISPEIKPLQPYYQDQEIDLVDLWLVLHRRRALFFGIVLAALATAIALILFMPPVYESRVVMQIGQVGGAGASGATTSIEPSGVLVERLNEEYRVNDTSEGKREYPVLANVTVNKGQPNIVTLTARAHTREDARSYLATVVGKIQREHDQLWKEVTSQQRARLDLIAERVQRMRQQMQSLDTLSASKTSNPTQLAMLMQEKSKFLLELPALEEEQSALALSLSRLQTLPTRLLREPTAPTSPEQPRPVLYLSLALIIGVMLGAMAIFFAEFITNARQRLRVPT